MTDLLASASRVPRRDPGAAKSLSRLARGSGWSGRLAIVVPLVAGALLLPQAWLLAHILHAAIVDRKALDVLVAPIGWLLALFVTRAMLGVVGEVLAQRSGEFIKLNLRRALVDDLLNRAPVWTGARASGRLAGLAVEQVEALEGYFVRYLPAMVQAAILPLAFAITVFPLDWVVGLLFLVTAPLIPVFMALAGWGAEAASRAQATALARLSGHFADRLRGLTTLKLFGRVEIEIAGVRSATEDLRHRTMRVMRIAFLSSAVLEFFAALGVAGVALYVGLTFLDLIDLRAGPLTLEAGLFCLLLAPEVYQPLRLLAANYHDRAAAKAAISEITGVLGEMPRASAHREPQAYAGLPDIPISLSLTDVSVTSPTGRVVIDCLSFNVAPASHHAILGSSGCGKSTLIEAIARLRESTGRIHVNGRALNDIVEHELRLRVAFLGQRPRLLAGTIADNIRFGRRDARETEVRLAAERAGVMMFASSLPLGLDTLVGETGIGLSGGEAQRVALARIYLRDPGLILLDEPTAHLDETTEAMVLDGLLNFARGRTLVVATHSLAVARRTDHAWRLSSGRLQSTIVPRDTQVLPERGAA